MSAPSPLGRLTAALLSLVSLALGGSGLGYFLSPLFQKKEEGWVDMGPADAFQPRRPERVEFVQRRRDAWAVSERRASAWVVASDRGAVTVFDPRCTHLGCPYRWDVKDGRFVCPCHTAAFGMQGEVLSGPPPRALDRYQAKVERGRLWVVPEPEGEKP